MSLEEPNEAERYAIAVNEYRHHSREDLLDRAVEERANDFHEWPAILHDYLGGLAEDGGIAYEDAAANAIYTPDGVAEMREWASDHAPGGDADAASPAAAVGLIERHYPGGLDGWRRRPSPPEAVSPLRRIVEVVRGAIRRVR